MSPNELLKERFALITGGTSGIGYSIAKSFLRNGASVCITSRDENKIIEACNKLKSISNDYSKSVFDITLDNRDISSFPIAINKILAFGDKIDILVNNAGILGGNISNAIEEEYDKVFDTNLKGVLFLSQLIGKYMKENHVKGNILNIASSPSLRPVASAYTISKWGTRGLTLGLAKCLAPYNITVNGITPCPTAPHVIKKHKQYYT